MRSKSKVSSHHSHHSETKAVVGLLFAKRKSLLNLTVLSLIQSCPPSLSPGPMNKVEVAWKTKISIFFFITYFYDHPTPHPLSHNCGPHEVGPQARERICARNAFLWHFLGETLSGFRVLQFPSNRISWRCLIVTFIEQTMASKLTIRCINY